MDIYKAELMDHFKNPRNRGKIEAANIITEELNPSCGDSVQFFIVFDKGKIKQISFLGKGCVISQASASMLTEKVINRSSDDLKCLDSKFMIDLIGVQLGPNRLQCAMLPLIALHKSF